MYPQSFPIEKSDSTTSVGKWDRGLNSQSAIWPNTLAVQYLGVSSLDTNLPPTEVNLTLGSVFESDRLWGSPWLLIWARRVNKSLSNEYGRIFNVIFLLFGIRPLRSKKVGPTLEVLVGQWVTGTFGTISSMNCLRGKANKDSFPVILKFENQTTILENPIIVGPASRISLVHVHIMNTFAPAELRAIDINYSLG